MGKRIAVLIIVMSVSFSGLVPAGRTENLVYSDTRKSFPTDAGAAHVGSGSSPVVPVAYNVTGPTPPGGAYNLFMQSPYSRGPMSQQYAGNPYPAAGADVTRAQSAYPASEISPYTQYSPYTEIIGEGSSYKLGIDDVVTVLVRNQPDFSGRFVIDPEGNIQYNYVGDVNAEGKTKGELKAAIIKRLKRFVRYPEVAVMISQYRSKNVFVFGFVNRPGKYAMKGNKITVKEAIVAAGLPTVDAALGRVYVVRPSEFTKDKKAKKTKVNLKKLIQQGDSAEDFLLEPGDTIVVRQKYFDRFVNGFSRLVGPVFQTAAVYELAYGDSGNNGLLR